LLSWQEENDLFNSFIELIDRGDYRNFFNTVRNRRV